MLSSPSREQRLAWILLGGAMAVAVAFLFWLQRDLAFDGDSFNWIALSKLGSSEALITPYGGHLIFTPLAIFALVIDVAGATYTAMGVVQVALLLILSVLIYEYGRRRIGPLLALPAAIVILFLGSSSSVLIQPMLGIQFFCALVPGVAGLLALERSDTRGDIAACIFFSLASVGFEMGLAFVVGGAVSIALRDDRRRRTWIVAVPFLIYGAWRIWAAKYGGSGLELSNVPWIPVYAVDSLGVIGSSLFGLFLWPGSGQLTYLKLVGFDFSHVAAGLVTLTVEVFAIALVVRRLIRRGPIPASFWVALAVLVVIWIEQGLALAPNRTPGEVRYVLPDTIAFLLVALECARGIRASRVVLAAAVVLTVVSVIGNLPRFQEGRHILVEYSEGARSSLAAMEIDGNHMKPGFNPATEAPGAFVTGRETFIGPQYLATLNEHFGRFGYTVPELLAKPESVRQTADIVAAKGMGLKAVPSPDGGGHDCAPGTAKLVARLPQGGATLIARDESPLLLRRFGSNYAVDVGGLQPRLPTRIRVPRDSAGVAWHAYAPEGGRLLVCPL